MNDPVIEAWGKWLKTINPDDFSVESKEGKLNATQILEEMKNETEFGKNFKQSIYACVFQVVMNSIKQK